jgi:hypothetical protein
VGDPAYGPVETPLPPDPSYADTGIFIATDGDDTNGDGTIARPYRSIQHVLDNVASSNTNLILRGGTYRGAIRIRRPGIVIRSKHDEWARIECPVNDPDNAAIAVRFDVDAHDGSLQRLAVSGGYYYAVSFETHWDWGDPADRGGASRILLVDCKIHHAGRDCIKVKPGCDDITIRRCEIYASGFGYPAGTSPDRKNAEGIDNVNGDRLLVQDCHIHDTATTGLYFKGGATDCLVERTLVEDCGAAGILLGFDTSMEFFDTTANPQYYENIRGTARNNIVRRTRYAGIGIFAADGGRVYNNTVIDAATAGHAALYFGVTLQDYETNAAGTGRPPSVGCTLSNNLVCQINPAAGPVFGIRFANELGGLAALNGMPAADFNCYWSATGTPRFFDNRDTAGGPLADGDLAAWQARTGAEGHSFASDPLLDPASGFLTAGSPCIDAGVVLAGFSDDFGKAARGSIWDIGADEY